MTSSLSNELPFCQSYVSNAVLERVHLAYEENDWPRLIRTSLLLFFDIWKYAQVHTYFTSLTNPKGCLPPFSVSYMM